MNTFTPEEIAEYVDQDRWPLGTVVIDAIDIITYLQARELMFRTAAGRQCDNMAFLLNHVSLPSEWYGKFTKELAEDQARFHPPVSEPQS